MAKNGVKDDFFLEFSLEKKLEKIKNEEIVLRGIIDF